MLSIIDQAAQAAAEAVVAYWHEAFMPLHFTDQAEDRYGYALRKGEGEPGKVQRANPKSLRDVVKLVSNNSYWWQKKRKFPSAPDLVKSGNTMRMVESVMKIQSKVVKSRGEVQAVDVLNVPQYFYKYRQRTDGGFIDKPAELTRTIAAEEDALGKMLGGETARNIAEMSEKVTINE